MTRQEFIDSVETFQDLMDVAYEANYDFCNVCTRDDYDDYILDTVRDFSGNWEDIMNYLDNLPSGYDYYIHGDYDEWSGYYDDDIDYLKDEFLTWADYTEWFDPEESEEEEEEEEEEAPDEEEQEPELSLEDFLAFAGEA